jgi:hypothetical protein
MTGADAHDRTLACRSEADARGIERECRLPGRRLHPADSLNQLRTDSGSAVCAVTETPEAVGSAPNSSEIEGSESEIAFPSTLKPSDFFTLPTIRQSYF